MQGAKDLIASERGILVVGLVLASTVLVVLGKVTGDQWITYTQWAMGILVASKTITGVIETLKGPPQPPPPQIPTATVVKDGPTPPS